MKHSQTTHAGQSTYTKSVQSIYDFWELGILNTLVWRCPTKHLRYHFRKHVTLNHLDVGVGTGYFLDNCLLEQKRRLALLDSNNTNLEKAAERVKRFKPEVYQANILAPLHLPCKKFDSISINYLFHCLTGSIKEKAVILDSLSEYLHDGGKIFGSTILSHGVRQNFAAQKLMAYYNRKGIFSNTRDHRSGLRDELESRFTNVEIEVKGCVALFSARKGER
ncbi:class I SAM-dependent methyltransferase [Halodesulfovibrio marinisediminis]|uniref:Methyltransferase domain-containing protein n=1 Tax=Halodesulfovibrio marinisediminis DSM 17456 TaxID=1121457 RepID=A0A1N6IRT8_9BACT|nr:class I SAM-dependent methyltransferase [Halodesulfovibrio marinisediminis]SIO34767.1 Methyltransferase domain-containing protein [Halodesulfovibrio marinisediminis DSM 17456]